MIRNYLVTEKVFEKQTDANGAEIYVEKAVQTVKSENVGIFGYLKGMFTNGPVTVTENGEVKKSNLGRNLAIAAGVTAVAGGIVYAMSQDKNDNQNQYQPQYPNYNNYPQQYQPQPIQQVPVQQPAPQIPQQVEAPVEQTEAPVETVTFTETYSDGTQNSSTIDVTDYQNF